MIIQEHPCFIVHSTHFVTSCFHTADTQRKSKQLVREHFEDLEEEDQGVQDQAGSGSDDSLVDDLEDDAHNPDDPAQHVRLEYGCNSETQSACFLTTVAAS